MSSVVPVAYLAHGKISFSDRPYDKFQPLRFAVSTTASFIIAIGGMYWITEIAGRSYLLGIAWNWLMIPVMNFLIYMFWVFRASKAETQERERDLPTSQRIAGAIRLFLGPLR